MAAPVDPGRAWFCVRLRAVRLVLASLALVALACTEDTCTESRTMIGYDDPTASGTTPRDAMQHTAGTRTGVLTWDEGGETEVTVITTLDLDSALSVDAKHIGSGRLACFDSISMRASLQISTADGRLLESLEVDLDADDGGDGVAGRSDLRTHDFVGTLVASSPSELVLLLSWIDDDPGTLRGWLVSGDASVIGTDIVGEGHVVAQFEAALP